MGKILQSTKVRYTCLNFNTERNFAMTLLEHYSENYEFLSKTEMYCIDTCLKEINLTKFTIQSLADRLAVSTTTIFRMIKKLGYNSFNDFKYDFLFEKEKQQLFRKQSVNDILENIINDSSQTFEYLTNSDTKGMVHQLQNSRQLLICSSGLTSSIGVIFARKMLINNFLALHETDPYFLFMRISNMDHRDCLVILSKEGETKELLDVCKKAKLKNITIVLISEFGHSSLTELADYKLNVAKANHVGTDIDTRLQLHIAIEYLTKLLIHT